MKIIESFIRKIMDGRIRFTKKENFTYLIEVKISYKFEENCYYFVIEDINGNEISKQRIPHGYSVGDTLVVDGLLYHKFKISS